MEKMNLEQMENIRGGFEPLESESQWAVGKECFNRLNALITIGYDPGSLIEGFWDSCNS